MSETAYTVHFPDYFDAEEWDVVEKGWTHVVEIRAGANRFRPTFYDPNRLAQTIACSLASESHYYAEPNIVVIEVVDRAHITAAIGQIANRGFEGLTPVAGSPRS